MANIIVKKVDGDIISDFIDQEFTTYAKDCNVKLDYDEFCYAAMDESGNIIGALTGNAYYNEVKVGDLIVAKGCRKLGVGSMLLKTVEEDYKDKGYEIITLTTFGFQAPEFYKKHGFAIEYIRENKDPKISKYFLTKPL